MCYPTLRCINTCKSLQGNVCTISADYSECASRYADIKQRYWAAHVICINMIAEPHNIKIWYTLHFLSVSQILKYIAYYRNRHLIRNLLGYQLPNVIYDRVMAPIFYIVATYHTATERIPTASSTKDISLQKHNISLKYLPKETSKKMEILQMLLMNQS